MFQLPNSRRRARQRDGDNAGDAEESEGLVASEPFVVVAETEPDLNGTVTLDPRQRKSWADAELEIRAFFGAAVRLPIQLLATSTYGLIDRRPSEPLSSTATLNDELLHGLEHPFGLVYAV